MRYHPSFQITLPLSSNSMPKSIHTSANSSYPKYQSSAKSFSYSQMSNPDQSSSPSSSDQSIAVGNIVQGTVTKITDYGAFVEVSNARSGLVHISEIANTFINSVSDFLKVGQQVEVKIISVDQKGRIGLSIKRATKATLTGYARVVELGGDWGHPWGDDSETTFMDLGPKPSPKPHAWQPDDSLFQPWDQQQSQ